MHEAMILTECKAEFLVKGVTIVRGALDAGGMQLAEQAYEWSLHHPGPGARHVLQGVPGAFYQDHANPAAWPVYQPLLCDTGLSDLVADVIGSYSLWLLYEQIWLKSGSATERTPWHQDLPYVPMAGEHLATVWLNLDPVPCVRSLEFIPGSHRGPLYNPTAFDPTDRTVAMFAPGVWPALPDIESERLRWNIVSWDVDAGDVIIFHPAVLHGGAPTGAGARRRTISLRFFGDDACCASRPEAGIHEIDKLTTANSHNNPMTVMAHQPPGTPFRHPDFKQLR